MPEPDIGFVVPDTGSAYWWQTAGEVAVEAARLARAVRHPVKLIWTREEEFTWAYFRPGGVIDIAAAVHVDGTLAAWEYDNYNSGGAGIQMPYEVTPRGTLSIRCWRRRCGRDRIGRLPLRRTPSRAKRTWIQLPMRLEWIRSRSA